MRHLWWAMRERPHFLAYALLGSTYAAELALESVVPAGHWLMVGSYDALPEDHDRVLAVAERVGMARLPRVLVAPVSITPEAQLQHTDHVLLLPDTLTRRQMAAQHRALSRLKMSRTEALSTPGLWHGAVPHTEAEAQLLIGTPTVSFIGSANADARAELELRHMQSRHNQLVALPLLALAATALPLWVLRARPLANNFVVTLLPVALGMATEYATREYAEVDAMRQCARVDPNCVAIRRTLLEAQLLHNRNVKHGSLYEWLITPAGNDLAVLPSVTRRLQLLDRV